MSSLNVHGMFVGIVLKAGETLKLGLGEEYEGGLIHLSNACLHEPKDGGKTFIAVSAEGKQYNIACLQKDRQEMCSLDFFLLGHESVELTNKGKNEVHLCGNLEIEEEGHEHDDDCCSGSDEDGDDLDAMIDGEDSEEEGSEEEEDSGDEEELAKQVIAKLPGGANGKKAAQQQAAKQQAAKKEEKKPEQPKPSPKTAPQPSPKTGAQPSPKTAPQPSPKTGAQPSPKTAPQSSPATGPQDKKRKAEGQEAKQEEKKVKVAPAAAAAGGEQDGNYEKALVEYVKKSGRVNMSELGTKVPKPKEVAKKMGQFIKERPGVFKVENNFVELVKK